MFWWILFGFAGLFVVAVIIGMIMDKVNLKHAETIKNSNSMRYDEETKTLKVYHRIPENTKCLSVRSVYYDERSTSPKEVVFTSATSGGVTVGGFNTIGGDVTKKTRTAKGSKLYFLVPGGGEVETIVLSLSVLKEAKNSSIKDFLNDDSIIVRRAKNQSDVATFNTACKVFGISDTSVNISNQLEAERYVLTRSELTRIAKWLGGEDIYI